MKKFIILVFIFVGITVSSQTNLDFLNKIDNNIIEIKTLPLVKNNKFICFYRIIIVEQGYEHVSTSVYIQWLKYDEKENKKIMLSQVKVNEIEMWSLSLKKSNNQNSDNLITFSGTHTYTYEDGEIIIQISNIGKYKVIKLPKT